MSDHFTAGEVLIGLLILELSKDPRITAMAEVNDQEHFELGCAAPWFHNLVGRALMTIKERG